jgi:surface polysaccharide O-acyltransferase-like enzyme
MRKSSIDFLRILCILGVIAIHVTARTLEQSGYDILRIPFTFDVQLLSRFSVPLFFIISGFILEYKYKEITTNYFLKRFKLLIPYIFWSIIYFIFYYHNPIREVFTFDFIKALIKGSISIQMYFIPSIFILYLLFPILHKYLKVLSRPNILIRSTITAIVILNYDFFFHIHWFDPLRIVFLTIYIFVLGMMASHREEEIKIYIRKHIQLIISLLILSVVSIIYESKEMYLYTKNIEVIATNWRWEVYVYSLTLGALLFTYVDLLKNKHTRIIQEISNLSFYVFFSHLFFLSLFWKLWGSYLFSHTMQHILENPLFDISCFLFVTICSFGTGYLLHFIKPLRKVIGINY